mgnify:FL=1|nr:MAG TPA: protein of unknown function DUF1424 [Caudoviricetes sp.]
MPYIETTVQAGSYLEVYKCHSYRYQCPEKGNRKQKLERTTEQAAAVNERNAERKLRWLIQTNFSLGDIHLVVTYQKDKRPDPDGAKKEIRNALRRFQRVYEKEGLEFKYIHVTEYKSTAVHHHLIIPSIDIRLLTDKWKFGQLRPTFLYESGGYSELARYLIKETSKTFREDKNPNKKRWYGSRNLKKPKITKKIVKANTFATAPKERKGYILETDSYFSDYNSDGYPYVFYRYRKIE